MDGICMEYVWNMHGILVEYEWKLRGICGNIDGICVECLWHVSGDRPTQFAVFFLLQGGPGVFHVKGAQKCTSPKP